MYVHTSAKEDLQKAVSFTLGSGYQLDRTAFEYLTTKSQGEDPVNLMKKVIKKAETLPQKPLLITRSFMEKMLDERFFPEKGKTQVMDSSQSIIKSATKRTTHAYAEDVDSDIRILSDPTHQICSKGSIQEYGMYFQDRFQKIKRILKKRIDAKDTIPISRAVKSPVNSELKIIGMVTEKRESKKGVFLQLEDPENSITILVPRNIKHETRIKVRSLLLDQVICIVAVKGKNDLYFAKDVIWPEIPRRNPQKASIPVCAALISDLHVGSTMFMEEEFNRFLLWLNGKCGNKIQRNIASHVKYVVIAGDLVDGIGIYPGQINELIIQDIYEQYQAVSKLVERIPDYIELVVIPGNHDASRKALPQPALPKAYAEPLYEARKVHTLGNPGMIDLHGVKVLLYHGRGLDDANMFLPNTSFQEPDKAMKVLLQSRHLAPIYGKRTPIAPEKQDFLVIDRVPDIFHAGHVHVQKTSTYRGVLIINSGAWQKQTEFQRKMGLIPTPGVIPVVNLQTLQATTIDFTTNM